MTPDERRKAIVALVREKGRISVDDLAARLGASRETIRRDLTSLSRRGLVQKYHGGAAIPSGEGPFLIRMGENAARKARIARAAASLFAPGDVLFIDTGSTTAYFAEELARVENLTVFTNSATIAHTIGKVDNGARVFMPGGEYKADNRQMVGAMTVEHIRRFRARRAVLTIGAMNAADGVMDFNVEEAQVARAMIARADELIILADSSKFGLSGVFGVCPLEQIEILVTDAAPEGDLAAALKQAGTEIIIAS
jgi:DeoR family glycerol-3-phosphate regulon repressor